MTSAPATESALPDIVKRLRSARDPNGIPTSAWNLMQEAAAEIESLRRPPVASPAGRGEENNGLAAGAAPNPQDTQSPPATSGEFLAAAYTMLQFARDPNLIGCTTAFGVYMRRDRAIEVVEKMIKERAK